uniref:Orf:PZC109 protein n=1 Tax=Saccharomyces cerevisiae TaxID=4932 RepID=E9PAB7_YEASX|nr:orf:PZC109 [Saccharomyces cerevisiae]
MSESTLNLSLSTLSSSSSSLDLSSPCDDNVLIWFSSKLRLFVLCDKSSYWSLISVISSRDPDSSNWTIMTFSSSSPTLSIPAVKAASLESTSSSLLSSNMYLMLVGNIA